MSVRERFITLMEEENFSQSKFCKVTGYRQSSITKFVTGKTQYPKQDFFEAVKKAWPEINLNWLIMGRGDMYEDKHPELKYKGDLPTVKAVKDIAGGKPVYDELSISDKNSVEYVTKEEFDNIYGLLNKLLLFLIRKELLPEYAKKDSKMAEEIREILEGL